jgi:SRSO17 transposase
MDLIGSVAHLFDFAASGRKLTQRHTPRTDPPAPGEVAKSGAPTATSIAAEQAGIYVRGLLEAMPGDRNFENIAETVPGADHQKVQHFICDAPWEASRVLDWISARADAVLGGTPLSHLIVDESGFSKKGTSSAAVARQYNGRLGKVDNCQVGVFVALAAGHRTTLLEGRLYLPKEWTSDPARCDKVKIPADQREFKTKSQMALEMVATQRQRGVRFGWVGIDGGYGKDGVLLRALEDAGEIFVADIHSNQRIWEQDPQPAPPCVRTDRKSGTNPRPASPGTLVRDWIAQQSPEAWIEFKRRNGINGSLRGQFFYARIWLWDGKEEMARHWHLIAWRADEDAGEIKYVLSNAAADGAVLDLARMAASRFWVERALQDAKGAAGMGEYQMRSWRGWHRHMAMVMLATWFMLEQRILLSEELPLLSAEDIAWVLEKYLPKPQATEAEVQQALARRHRRRQIDIDSRKRRNPEMLIDIL